MGNKGFTNRAKSGQKTLPAQLKRVKTQVAADQRRSSEARRKNRLPTHTAAAQPRRAEATVERVEDVRVEAYAGSKADETPRRFTVGTRTIEVVAVTSRWRTPDHVYFKVTGDDGQTYVLRQDVTTDRWSLA